MTFTCKNCGNREDDFCMIAGTDWKTERLKKLFCDEHFNRWKPDDQPNPENKIFWLQFGNIFGIFQMGFDKVSVFDTVKITIRENYEF